MKSPLSDFAWKLMIVGLLLLLAGYVFGAPAPLPKPGKPLDVKGSWMVFYEHPYPLCCGHYCHVYTNEEMTFGRDGSCVRGAWKGRYKVEGRKLTVHEEYYLRDDNSYSRQSWSVELDGNMEGVFRRVDDGYPYVAGVPVSFVRSE